MGIKPNKYIKLIHTLTKEGSNYRETTNQQAHHHN
jgi:hypothetical protein